METRMTAPSVAAASEYQKPPPKIPSLTKTQPPIKEPTKPRTISAMQPNPRPRAIFPASHPAMRPIRSQPMTPFRYWMTKIWGSAKRAENRKCILPPDVKTLKNTLIWSYARMLSLFRRLQDSGLPRARLLLGHAVDRSEAKHQIAAGNSHNFPVW